ncbi:H-2 class II histocompatibility antigen, I-E beta chain-like isoform X1 [Amia ocellicauda]
MFSWDHLKHIGVEGYVSQIHFICDFHKGKVDDVVFIERRVFERIKWVEYDSRLGKYVGFTKNGNYNAEQWNKDPEELGLLRAYQDGLCKPAAANASHAILDKTVEPSVSITWTPALSSKQPTTLACHAFGFYPQQIKVTWLRNGTEVKHGVMFTDLMADGDWYYQIHSHLELMPRSGETISCRVEHSSLKEPLEIKWDPSMPGSDRNKIIIGASGLVLGLVIAAAGGVYYKKKSTGRILVPTS